MSAKHAGKIKQHAATSKNATGFAKPKYGNGYIDASHAQDDHCKPKQKHRHARKWCLPSVPSNNSQKNTDSET